MTTPLRYILRCDGRIEPLQHKASIHELCARIGAETTDVVRLRDAFDRVMLVDDQGYESELVQTRPSHFELRTIKARKPVNHAATQLYWEVCRPGTTHQIVGDVAIVPDSDFDGGQP